MHNNRPLIVGLALLCLATVGTASAQETSAPAVGIRDKTPRVHALTNARIVMAPGRVIESGTVVIRDGIIDAVGAKVAAPDGARIWDLEGHSVYAGFIDPMSDLGVPELPDIVREDYPSYPVELPAGPGYWNPRVRSNRRIADELAIDPHAAEGYRSIGYTTVLSSGQQGVFRGISALVNLGEVHDPKQVLIDDDSAHTMAFEYGGRDAAYYPTSLAGAIALTRQVLYDAQWYRAAHDWQKENPDAERAESNPALAVLSPVIRGNKPVIMRADDELDFARVRGIADEFGLDAIILGNGFEYRQRAALAGARIIVPLNFPEPPAVETPDMALDVSLADLQHWEMAPSNAAFLEQAGIDFAFTRFGLENPGLYFWSNVRKAIERGLDADAALAALTTRPAAMLGVSDRLGTVEKGKIANLIISDGNPFFDKTARVRRVFVDGNPYRTAYTDSIDPRGKWAVTRDGQPVGEWEITGLLSKLRAKQDDEEFTVIRKEGYVLLFPPAETFGGGEGTARLSARRIADTLRGEGTLPDGSPFDWQASLVPGDKEEKDEEIPPLQWSSFPAGAYGLEEQPAQPAAVLVQNATVWTQGPDGTLENADLLIRNGKIAAVGTGLTAPRGAVVIDATGKHVTPGLLDAHSHSALYRGINEFGAAVTSEVRMSDASDPTDISIYRQLAGGLTTAHPMHGSANPMGGQNTVIKLRWGEDADALKFAGAAPTVKFALGENVKQSNWGDLFNVRYPQTRMGVPQIMRDTFIAAQEYEAEWARWERNRSGAPPRKNLRLDAMVEILNRDRKVHIHSYRQDEILRFVRLAEEFDLEVAAFQHILEGYKVADAMVAINAGGSTFSDWWAYKFEVHDAIPYAGALMHNAGVVTSFNSDSSELARRLNTEGAKAIKYGGLSEIEALNFVTLYPAVQLRVDNSVGSLEAGKDGDFVIWNGHPLSTFSKAEQTWVDGRKYFDLDTDAQLREQMGAERQRLVQKALPDRVKKMEIKAARPSSNTAGAKPTGERLDLRGLYHDGADLLVCRHDGGLY